MKVLVGLGIVAIALLVAFTIYDASETNTTELGNQVEDAWDDTADYSENKADEFAGEVEFDDRDTLIEQAEEKLAEMGESLEEGAEDANEELREEYESLKATIENAKNASKEEWREASAKLKQAYDDTISAE